MLQVTKGSVHYKCPPPPYIYNYIVSYCPVTIGRTAFFPLPCMWFATFQTFAKRAAEPRITLLGFLTWSSAVTPVGAFDYSAESICGPILYVRFRFQDAVTKCAAHWTGVNHQNEFWVGFMNWLRLNPVCNRMHQRILWGIMKGHQDG